MEGPSTAGCQVDEDRGYAIYLWSGGLFYPGDPRVEDIKIEDIAHSLSLQCRYNGMCDRFYSVAEHSVHCWKVAPEHLKREALLHDASEAYTGGDMPRPIKHIIPGYHEFEQKIERVVHTALRIPIHKTEAVAFIDDTMLATEKRILCPRSEMWAGLPDPLHWDRLPCWSPPEAERQFLKAYRSLSTPARASILDWLSSLVRGPVTGLVHG